MQTILNPDRALQAYMGMLISKTSNLDSNPPVETWKRGNPLKLLLTAYLGARNTGSDVRVEEMIRQFNHIFGIDNLQLTVLTFNPELSKNYFKTTRQIEFPKVFPGFLYKECPKHHGVVACEGSMFKSKFSDAFTTMMAGSLGMAGAENKLSIGYGAEAGTMTPALENFVQKHCQKSLVICRNDQSRKVLEKLGIRTTGGSDTAWTFEPSPLEIGKKLLMDQGWDGITPILALCPINPFWWPVKPDLFKFASRFIAGQYKNLHYQSVYFHSWSNEAEKKYRYYLESIANAVKAFSKEKLCFPVLVGMEMLDRKACEDLNELLPQKAPLFSSDSYNMYDLVSVLRNCSMMISSRFHAIVTSMPGLVLSAGVTMDERIRNLMSERGHEDLFLEVDEEKLDEKLLTILRKMNAEKSRISDEIAKTIPKQLKKMGEMGIDFEQEVSRVYPEFPIKSRTKTWEHYLPSLPKAVLKIMEDVA